MFKAKFPAFYALIALVADAAKDTTGALSSNASLLSKLLSYENLLPEFLAFLPLASQLAAEAKAMGAVDIEQAAETLVADLAFQSDKAKAVIAAGFGVVDWLVAGIAPVEALVVAVKS